MKSMIRNLGVAHRKTESDFNLGSTIAVILLLLLFISTSFYLMVTNY